MELKGAKNTANYAENSLWGSLHSGPTTGPLGRRLKPPSAIAPTAQSLHPLHRKLGEGKFYPSHGPILLYEQHWFKNKF